MAEEVQSGKFLKGSKRFLVMARVGDSSLHKAWIKCSEERNFDLFLEYYGDGSNDYRNDCDFYSEGNETKWPRLYKLIETWNENIFTYDAVWFPDDDIYMDCLTVNEMFNLFTEYNLLLAQPGLTSDSYWSHFITLGNKKFILRYTNFVEVMAPIFSNEALKLCWETFRKCKSGWGLDSVWPKILGYPDDKIAILDKILMKHTRPIGDGELYKDIDCNPKKERSNIEAEYGVTNAYDFIVYNKVVKKPKKNRSNVKRESKNTFFKNRFM